MDAPEEVLLDQNAMAEGHGFFQVSDWVVSPDNKLLAWAEDTVGRRQYVLKVKSLETGEMLPDIRSEEHTSELQSLMRISYAVFCLNKKTTQSRTTRQQTLNTTYN